MKEEKGTCLKEVPFSSLPPLLTTFPFHVQVRAQGAHVQHEVTSRLRWIE